ncbi:protein rep, partial [Aeromonas veronii]
MNWRRPNAGNGLADIDVCKGTHGKAFYQGLMACGDIWGCACCAGKVSERRRLELQAAIASATALGWATHFVTLTVPHGVGDDLDILLASLSDSLKRLSTGKYSLKSQLAKCFPGCTQHGYIRATEVTHGEHGWHPHFHILVFTSPDLSPADLRSVYSPAWQRACLLSGLPKPHDVHGVTVQDGTK